jgi:hypothetical protein
VTLERLWFYRSRDADLVALSRVLDRELAAGRFDLPRGGNLAKSRHAHFAEDIIGQLAVNAGDAKTAFIRPIRGKIAPLGKQRIATFADDGTLAVTVKFAAGEGAVTLQGYAPRAHRDRDRGNRRSGQLQRHHAAVHRHRDGQRDHGHRAPGTLTRLGLVLCHSRIAPLRRPR